MTITEATPSVIATCSPHLFSLFSPLRHVSVDVFLAAEPSNVPPVGLTRAALRFIYAALSCLEELRWH